MHPLLQKTTSKTIPHPKPILQTACKDNKLFEHLPFWKLMWVWVNTYRYIFSGMNIHLPAILGFTRYQGFDPSPYSWCSVNGFSGHWAWTNRTYSFYSSRYGSQSQIRQLAGPMAPSCSKTSLICQKPLFPPEQKWKDRIDWTIGLGNVTTIQREITRYTGLLSLCYGKSVCIFVRVSIFAAFLSKKYVYIFI